MKKITIGRNMMEVKYDGGVLAAKRDVRILVVGYVGAGFSFVAVPEGSKARREFQGPLLDGPWVDPVGIASVIDNHGGTGAEIERGMAAGTVFVVAIGDLVEFEGVGIYQVAPDHNRNIKMIPVADAIDNLARLVALTDRDAFEVRNRLVEIDRERKALCDKGVDRNQEDLNRNLADMKVALQDQTDRRAIAAILKQASDTMKALTI